MELLLHEKTLLVSVLVVGAHAKPVMAQQEARELVPTASKVPSTWPGYCSKIKWGDCAFITQLDAYMESNKQPMPDKTRCEQL